MFCLQNLIIACFNLERLSSSSRLARPGISTLLDFRTALIRRRRQFCWLTHSAEQNSEAAVITKIVFGSNSNQWVRDSSSDNNRYFIIHCWRTCQPLIFICLILSLQLSVLLALTTIKILKPARTAKKAHSRTARGRCHVIRARRGLGVMGVMLKISRSASVSLCFLVAYNSKLCSLRESSPGAPLFSSPLSYPREPQESLLAG